MPDDPERQSPPIQILNVSKPASAWERILIAVTRSAVVMTVMLTGSWLLINRIEIPAPAWGLATLIVVGTFDLERLYKKIKNGNLSP